MRIVYIIDTLSTKGGAERIISEKMNYMATRYGYDVSIITCYQFPDSMPNCYYLSDKVKQINLCIPLHEQYRHPYPQRLLDRWGYIRQLRMKLQETVNSIKPDIIIGVGYVLADEVCRIKYQATKIIEAHEARIFTKTFYLHQDFSFLTNLYFKLSRKLYLRTIEKKADIIITLTKEDATNWRKAKRVEIIPNFSIMSVSKLSNGDVKRAIAIGRLEWQKGYDRLINIWKLVGPKHPDWQLDIYGEGTQEFDLTNAIKESNISNAAIHPFTNNISQEYATSSVCVLTSRYEGFSLVLLEALRHGVPCITFDCPYGPKELVSDDQCGYVIENGNIDQFAEKLSFLMDHAETRKQFGKAAIIKAQSYQIDTIMNQWKQLFESLTSN